MREALDLLMNQIIFTIPRDEHLLVIHVIGYYEYKEGLAKRTSQRKL